MSQKIVFFDIDGTLYNPEIGVPESTVKGIEKLLENNHIPIISTGRAGAMIPKSMIDIGFQGIIAAGGADVSFENNEIHQIVEDKDVARTIVDLLRKGDLAYVLEGPQYIYYEKSMVGILDPHLTNLVNSIGIEKFKIIGEEDIVFNKISATVNKNSVIHSSIKDRYEIIEHSEIPVVEIVPKGYNKAVGVKAILEYLGADKKNTYAFGDSNNDIDMLDYVEYGIAMGNAYPDVLEKAKYRTKSIYEDGIYYGLKEFGLI